VQSYLVKRQSQDTEVALIQIYT